MFALTAAHVVGSLSWAYGSGRDDVALAANSGVPGSGDPTIGHVCASHPPAPCDEVFLDAALVAPVASVTLNDVVRADRLSGIPRDVEAAEDLLVVHKRGIQGRATEGLLEPFAASVVLESPQPDGTRIARSYPRVFLVHGVGSAFARPGDSGAVVVDDDDCVVGMLVGLRAEAGTTEHDSPGIVVSILDILHTLGLELTGPQRPCTLD